MADELREIYRKDCGTGAASQGWVQWKGTDVCMDVRCECGELTHVDAMFCYFLKCGNCGRKFLVGAHVTLYPLNETEAELVGRFGNGFIESQP